MRSSPTRGPRRSSRHIVRVPCQVVRERDFQLIADRIMDLSVSGMLVGPADPVLTGERLIISFRLPHSSTWVDAEATVARVVHGRRPGEYTRSLALEFEDIGAYPRFMLRELLRGVPPAPPKSLASRLKKPGLLGQLLQKRKALVDVTAM